MYGRCTARLVAPMNFEGEFKLSSIHQPLHACLLFSATVTEGYTHMHMIVKPPVMCWHSSQSHKLRPISTTKTTSRQKSACLCQKKLHVSSPEAKRQGGVVTAPGGRSSYITTSRTGLVLPVVDALSGWNLPPCTPSFTFAPHPSRPLLRWLALAPA